MEKYDGRRTVARDARMALQLRIQAAADLAANEVEGSKDRQHKLAKIAELQRGITLLDKQYEVAAARARLRVYDCIKSYTVPSFEDVDDSISHDVDDIV